MQAAIINSQTLEEVARLEKVLSFVQSNLDFILFFNVVCILILYFHMNFTWVGIEVRPASSRFEESC